MAPWKRRYLDAWQQRKQIYLYGDANMRKEIDVYYLLLIYFPAATQ